MELWILDHKHKKTECYQMESQYLNFLTLVLDVTLRQGFSTFLRLATL